MVSKHFYPIHN